MSDRMPLTQDRMDLADARSSARIPALDGIRGVAICLVLLWHSIFGAGLPNHPNIARIIGLGRLSWSGVDLFFVLSGFLIGGILLDARKAEHYFFPFYIRRAHRILPLYGLVLLLVFSVSYLCFRIGVTGPWKENTIPLWYYPTFLQNFWMARHGSFGSYTLGITWSLAIEEQFYLTLPLMIRHVSRSRLWWVLAAMIAGAPLLRMFLNHSVTNGVMASYVLMPCRADALGWGVIAALLERTPRAWGLILHRQTLLCAALGGLTIGLAALLLSPFAPLTNDIFSLEYSLLAAFYFLLLVSVLVNRKFERFFSCKALRYMGTIAYGLYLLHRPFMRAIGEIVYWRYPGQSGWLSLLVSTSGIGLAIAAATTSWEYLEKPLIQRGHRYRYGQKGSQTSSSD